MHWFNSWTNSSIRLSVVWMGLEYMCSLGLGVWTEGRPGMNLRTLTLIPNKGVCVFEIFSMSRDHAVADPGFLVRGAQRSFDPKGSPKMCSKSRGVFPLNCLKTMFLKNLGGKGGGSPGPPGSASARPGPDRCGDSSCSLVVPARSCINMISVMVGVLAHAPH